MIYELSYLILLLPLLSFLVLGLAGMKMQHKTAGLIGTCSLSLVTVLSYLTAITYFTAPRTAEGIFQTIVPFNFT
jgi:NADH-quinone oxidoreductase subunit L